MLAVLLTCSRNLQTFKLKKIYYIKKKIEMFSILFSYNEISIAQSKTKNRNKEE